MCVCVTCFCPWISCLRTAGHKAAGYEPDLGGTQELLHPPLQIVGTSLEKKNTENITHTQQPQRVEVSIWNQQDDMWYRGSQLGQPASPCWSCWGSCTAAPAGSCCRSGWGQDRGPSLRWSPSLSPPETDGRTQTDTHFTANYCEIIPQQRAGITWCCNVLPPFCVTEMLTSSSSSRIFWLYSESFSST